MENRGLVAQLVEQDFGLKWNGGRWARAIKHDSLIVNMEKDFWFWNSENKFGNALDYLVFVRKLDRTSAEHLIRSMHRGTPSLIEEVPSVPYEKLVDILWNMGKTNRDYWYRRMLNDSTIDRFRLGFYKGWNLIPLYKDGRFINFQCRMDIPEKRIKSWYKGMETVIFNDDILKFTNKVFITEGPVDAMLLTQYGLPAVSHNGGAQGFKKIWVNDFNNQDEITYIADNDKAGVEAAKGVVKILGTAKTKVFRFKDKPEKYDTVDYFRDGGTLEEFKNLIKEKSVYGFQEGDI